MFLRTAVLIVVVSIVMLVASRADAQGMSFYFDNNGNYVYGFNNSYVPPPVQNYNYYQPQPYRYYYYQPRARLYGPNFTPNYRSPWPYLRFGSWGYGY